MDKGRRLEAALWWLKVSPGGSWIENAPLGGRWQLLNFYRSDVATFSANEGL
jgi:hypothetical protein